MENRDFIDGQSFKQLQIQLEEALHELTNLKDLNSKLTIVISSKIIIFSYPYVGK